MSKLSSTHKLDTVAELNCLLHVHYVHCFVIRCGISEN
jgi:hypothetical protein